MMTTDLFGSSGKKPKKVRKPRAENADAVARLEALHAELYASKWGGLQYRPLSIGRNRKHLADLERVHGEQEIALGLYFRTADRRVISGAYDIPDFFRLVPYLLLADRKGTQDERTLANIDAAQRAVGRRK